MTDEEINIAIAEACGWTACGQTEGRDPHGYPPEARKPTTKDLLDGTGPDPWDIPSYTSDLNAMHEVEKHIGDHNHDNYLLFLAEAAGYKDRPEHDRDEHLYWCYDATARQRAEAFLKTLNLWEE